MHRLTPTLSPPSPRSSTDSLTLFPRPLTFRRTVAAHSPLVSPTPLGRHVQNAVSSQESLQESLSQRIVDRRPVTRGKSPRSQRYAQGSTAFCLPRVHGAASEANAEPTYPNLEGDPLRRRLRLARLGGDKRRSSLASFSTLQIPRSFRPGTPRGGSSIYSRDTAGAAAGVAALPDPGHATNSLTALPTLPSPNSRRATSFDENIFQDLDWNLQHVNGRLDVSSASESEKEGLTCHLIPCTPRLPERQMMPETPEIGTASSATFGTRMTIPKIRIASTSDDVFGGDGLVEKETDFVVENGRVLRRVRAMESKLSQEDLAKYGGKTAPGNVEWF